MLLYGAIPEGLYPVEQAGSVAAERAVNLSQASLLTCLLARPPRRPVRYWKLSPIPNLKQVDTPPDGPEWLHEIKFDGYRMHARIDRGDVRLLTRTGLDWTHKYPAIAGAVASLPAKQAYLDGELCGVGPDGITSFSMSSPPVLG